MREYAGKLILLFVTLALFACAASPKKDPAVEQEEKAHLFWEKMDKSQGVK